MIKRDLSHHIKDAARKFPVIGVVGPRQSGKTTLVKAIFPKFKYISLEDPDHRLFAKTDPRGFLSTNPPPVIFDEIQKVPDLFSYLQTEVDKSNSVGQYVLTGSQHFLLHQHISQTLAGRIKLFSLLPLTASELKQSRVTFETYNEYLFNGMYPRLYEKSINPTEWYPAYIQTFIERDIRSLKNVGDLSTFQTFVKLCAGRVGQLLNLSSLARDCGITHNTAKSWLSLLETSFIIFLLPPYYENFGKRLTKMPKLYFYDTGLVCSLLGLRQPQDLSTHYLKGNLFENFIIAEYIKQKSHHQHQIEYYFWRDKTGHEIDLIGVKASSMLAIEIKSGQTVSSDYFSELDYFSKIQTSKRDITPFVIYGGDQTQRRHNIIVLGKNAFINNFPE